MACSKKLYVTICAVGKAWKKGRRDLPSDARVAFVNLLNVLKPHMHPRAGATLNDSIAEARPGVADFFVLLALTSSHRIQGVVRVWPRGLPSRSTEYVC